MPVSQPQSRSLECKNLHDYLQTLQSDQLDNLYNHPATCLAVFRELPPLAKQIVMRLLFVQQAVPQAVVSSWVTAQPSLTQSCPRVWSVSTRELSARVENW